MAIDDPATAKVGGTIPVRLTVRNDGPNDATQVAVRTYLPPGASLTGTTGLSDSSLVIPRLAPGAEIQLEGKLRVRIADNASGARHRVPFTETQEQFECRT